MSELLNTLLSSQGYIPHGHCYLWKPQLVWLHIVSNGAIALAYFSIPILLVYFVSKRKDVPFNSVFFLFGTFIIACGSGHLMDIWTIWHPNYWLSGILKALTAIVSLYTALELSTLLPKALTLPSPAQLEAANTELEKALKQLQQTQSQLVQTEKMSSLGQLVAGVAHEINNPISFIQGNLTYVSNYAQKLINILRLYQQTYPQIVPAIQHAFDGDDLAFIEEDLPKIMLSMNVGVDRIKKIVLSLHNFSRLDQSEIKSVNIHDGIDSTLLILQSRLSQVGHSGIQIIKEYGDLPILDCYAGDLNQVFMNILSNAIDALETRSDLGLGIITIQTQYLEPDHVLIKIADNGPGMTSTIKQKIFNAFFTTKPVGKGTGLGLSISYQIIVEKHGGHLECLSEPNQGTTFLIKIPVRQQNYLSTQAKLDNVLESAMEPAL